MYCIVHCTVHLYRHGVLSSWLVMDVPAQISLSHGPILSFSLFSLQCFFGSSPFSKLGRTPCLYMGLRCTICRRWPSKVWHTIWIETKAKRSFVLPIFSITNRNETAYLELFVIKEDRISLVRRFLEQKKTNFLVLKFSKWKRIKELSSKTFQEQRGINRDG